MRYTSKQSLRGYDKAALGSITPTLSGVVVSDPRLPHEMKESNNNPVLPPKKKYVVAISMVRDGYVSPIVDVNSQVINSNINRVYYCDQKTLIPLVDPSNMASVFNIDPIEQGFDYIEGNDLQSLNYGGQQFPAGTVFFYELEDDSYIEDYMFYGLVFAIYVPDTITSIGDYAFYTEGMNLIGMESETPPEKQENSFNFGLGRTLLVPTNAAAEAYSSAWDLNPEYIEVPTANPDGPIDDNPR